MEFNIGDYVTRDSYNNDTIFKIVDIKKEVALLKGVDIRLYADSKIDDLVKCDYKNNDDEILSSRIDVDDDDDDTLPPFLRKLRGDK